MNKKVSDQTISESDIRAIYHQGEDAVVELVTRLIERIERLEERVDKDSRNSSKRRVIKTGGNYVEWDF